MKKDFGAWHRIKEWVDGKPDRLLFGEREVWWCWLGANVGSEQDGGGEHFMRPVLVFKKFNNETFWALPITTQVKQNIFHKLIDLRDGISRSVNLSQLKLLDAKRLGKKISIIEEPQYIAIQKAIMILIS